MDILGNLISNNDYVLLMFECRYGGILTGIIAPKKYAIWIEEALNGDDPDWDQMSQFLDHYKDYLFYDASGNTTTIMQNLDNKVKNTSQTKFDEQFFIFEWGYNQYEYHMNKKNNGVMWFDESTSRYIVES